ncbi:hypothetical protein Moror_4073 [Moniliophthora roreri MCA 2997]|uniref:Uncharacterized protein n=1 Tax=Moniliophthora roreri (strain MCA 2997) TaxID=1381753 RepID=V2XE47_MONRO|nr:hypothetical protein Moror_4073 [Moniliophthora roreri MCA 2997]
MESLREISHSAIWNFYPLAAFIYSTLDHTVIPKGMEVAMIDMLPVVILVAGIAPALIIARAQSRSLIEQTVRADS